MFNVLLVKLSPLDWISRREPSVQIKKTKFRVLNFPSTAISNLQYVNSQSLSHSIDNSSNTGQQTTSLKREWIKSFQIDWYPYKLTPDCGYVDHWEPLQALPAFTRTSKLLAGENYYLCGEDWDCLVLQQNKWSWQYNLQVFIIRKTKW